jgi:hypothetical protein
VWPYINPLGKTKKKLKIKRKKKKEKKTLPE